MTARELYLDLLKGVLTDSLYDTVDPEQRNEGRDWPSRGCTMIGRKRLDNLQRCIEDVIDKGVPGDLIETGVWRGGATIFMRALLKLDNVRDRTVWVADSFQGLPPPDPGRYPADEGDAHHTMTALAVSADEVRANFAKFGVLDEGVRFLEGWFEQTLSTPEISRLAVLRLDGDMYGSTMVALEQLYHRVSEGGYVIIDDYGAVPGCRKAVDDFRARHGITEPMHAVDWTGVYWQRRGIAGSAASLQEARTTIDAFHALYYNGMPGEGLIFQRTFWMGVPCWKCPLDLWVYQEILHEIRPDLIIETGTNAGGSALYLAHILDILGHGQVVSIDITDMPRPAHPRVRYITGSSADPQVIASAVRGTARGVCMVVLDSDHTKEHVGRELELLAPYVTPGSYLVVEDTNINGHPVYPTFGPGPHEAVSAFLQKHPEFVVDPTREKFLLTFNPGGFLRRRK